MVSEIDQNAAKENVVTRAGLKKIEEDITKIGEALGAANMALSYATTISEKKGHCVLPHLEITKSCLHKIETSLADLKKHSEIYFYKSEWKEPIEKPFPLKRGGRHE